MRSGQQRHVHFYHLAHSSSCRLSGKSLIHLQIQLFLQKLIPKEEVQIEYRFSEIGRIADVAWLSKKIVFEVQCSPITAVEVQERVRDYESIGFQVVWILHEKRFNQWRMTAAEQYLQNKIFYYTNMDAQGRGVIYDQFNVIEKGIRKMTLPLVPVNLREPIEIKFCETKLKQIIPAKMIERMKNRKIHFAEDLADRCVRDLELAKNYFEKVIKPIEIEATIIEQIIEFFKKAFYKYLVRPYFLIFQMILERACK